MSLESVLIKHADMMEQLETAFKWKPKGFTYFTRLLIQFAVYVVTFLLVFDGFEQPFYWVMFDAVTWLGTYYFVSKLVLTLHLMTLTQIPRVPIKLMRELDVPRKVITGIVRKWYWKNL